MKLTVEKFTENYDIVVKDDIKTNFKGLSYLAWAKAWRLLKEKDPDADYEIVCSENGIIWEQLGTYLVRTRVTAFEQTKEMWLSIMDNNHNAVKLEPYDIKLKTTTQHVDAMDSNHVSNALVRCLTKNIAMFGIGLKLYEGEDIPVESESSSNITKKNKQDKLTPQEKLSNLCKEILSDKPDKRPKVLEILKEYDPKGNPKNMTAVQAKEGYKKMEILMKELKEDK